jgi:hypothetical protein
MLTVDIQDGADPPDLLGLQPGQIGQDPRHTALIVS